MEAKDSIILTLPCKPGYVSVARLTASGIASRSGFDIDTVEDIKVAVSEVCNRIISLADTPDRQYEIRFDIYSDKLKVYFNSDIDNINCLFSEDGDGLGIAIINAFMDEVEYCPNGKNFVFSMTRNFEVISSNELQS